ncbi:hypothetical protein ABIB40_003688 [Pedobacter sp. UYP30]|uniref:hypothetical protein n=1 Tax=Pedobacter sp. UYP30 TaxID=1756400 RepID=UPI003394CAF2
MMKQEEIFNKVGNILAELNQQYEYLAKNTSELNDLEVELFLANADFLADHVKIIQKLNNTNLSKSKEVKHDFVAEVAEHEPESFSPESDNTAESEALEEIVAAEQDEARVDVKPEVEVKEEEHIRQEITEERNNDFFKPDLDDRSFEFELERMVEARGDVEEHETAENQEETEVQDDEDLGQLEKADEPTVDEDEIGPEPFLIHDAEDEKYEIEETKDSISGDAEPEDEETAPASSYSVPTTAERNERNGIDLQSGSLASSGVGSIPSFSPEVVSTEPLPNIFEKKEGTTLNDLLAKKNVKPELSLKAPISDLKNAINLNEKMLFIKDLFSGYNMAYSEAIDLVNKMTTFDNAEKFLRNNYAAKNNWANKQNTVDKFYELLHRRFDK